MCEHKLCVTGGGGQEAGGGQEEGRRRRTGCRTKNKNPTQRCGEKVVLEVGLPMWRCLVSKRMVSTLV